MPKLTLGLRTVAPTFLKGSDPKGTPEFRVASIRGQLRYWLRALAGAQSQDLSEVWKRESAVFGSTQSGSLVTVRVSKGVVDQKDENGRAHQAFLLPHREGGSQNPSRDFAIRAGTQVRLDVLTRPGVQMPPSLMDALSLWLLLGGVGKRSRRMMGGLQATSAKVNSVENVPTWLTDLQNLPKSMDEWVKTYRDELNRVVKVGSSPKDIPAFPTLHPKHCCVLVGQRLFGDATEANRALFRELLRSKFLSDETMFGFAGGGGRRASPVIAQVRTIGQDYFPVITLFRSPIRRPKGAITDWDILNRFIEAAKTTFNAQIVHGGKFE
jgi:CRISPR-associated protein Cmr1